MTNKMSLAKFLLLGALSMSLAACAKGSTVTSNGTVSDLTTTATTDTTTSTVESDSFPTNSGLYAGQSYTNTSGFTLSYQYDGNLVVSNASAVAVWSSQTSGKCYANCYMVFQNDGNLVLYSNGNAYWASGTAGSELKNEIATQLILTETAPYLQIEDANDVVLWSSSTTN